MSPIAEVEADSRRQGIEAGKDSVQRPAYEADIVSGRKMWDGEIPVLPEALEITFGHSVRERLSRISNGLPRRSAVCRMSPSFHVRLLRCLGMSGAGIFIINERAATGL